MKINSYYKTALLIISIALIFSGTAFAEMTTIEGKIGGANCILDKKICPMSPNDPLLAVEVDFILSAADGKYYFIPNLSRSHKIELVNKDIRIIGDLHGISLVASVIEEKKDGTYNEIWNWKKIAKSLSRGR
ncbi:MAG: hypothetical protein C0403_06660 [Desulfobacterium sp.]|nr:hypothetical protein [Desulfobacterium sp.]